MNKKIIACVLLCVVFSGCSDTKRQVKMPSMNKQLATLNGVTQLAVAAVFDEVDESKLDVKIKKTKEVVAEVRRFMVTGAVGGYSVNELKKQLDKIVPPEYQPYSEMLLTSLVGVNVPTEKIGANNVIRLFEVLDALEYRCERYNKDWR